MLPMIASTVAPLLRCVKTGEIVTPLTGFPKSLHHVEEVIKPEANPDTAAMMFICKVSRLNYSKLSDEEKAWFKKIAKKSNLLKNPNLQRGRRRK